MRYAVDAPAEHVVVVALLQKREDNVI